MPSDTRRPQKSHTPAGPSDSVSVAHSRHVNRRQHGHRRGSQSPSSNTEEHREQCSADDLDDEGFATPSASETSAGEADAGRLDMEMVLCAGW